MDYKDERREFIEETRSASRDERILFAMGAIIEGETCLDRLFQMYDVDDFEGAPQRAITAALAAEADEETGDYELARALAQEVADDFISEFLPNAQTR